MTIEKLDQLHSEMKMQIAAAKGLTAIVTAHCSFIRKLDKKAQPQDQVYEAIRTTYLDEAYNSLKAHILKVKALLETSSQRFFLEDNDETHENWEGISFNAIKEKIKQANNLITNIDREKRKWRELNSRIEYLPECQQKNDLQTLLETMRPLANQLDNFKAPLKIFGLRQKYYRLTWDIEEEDIAFKDAEKIITASIQELKTVREITQDQNRIQKIDQLINRFQTLNAAFPEAASRQNSRNRQTTFSSQNNSTFFIPRAYSLRSTQSSQSTQPDDVEFMPPQNTITQRSTTINFPNSTFNHGNSSSSSSSSSSTNNDKKRKATEYKSILKKSRS